ncbi:hypothetical protein KCU89_g33, partial [Aureobasidium melanogenum]
MSSAMVSMKPKVRKIIPPGRVNSESREDLVTPQHAIERFEVQCEFSATADDEDKFNDSGRILKTVEFEFASCSRRNHSADVLLELLHVSLANVCRFRSWDPSGHVSIICYNTRKRQLRSSIDT